MKSPSCYVDMIQIFTRESTACLMNFRSSQVAPASACYKVEKVMCYVGHHELSD
jgi:hypothetical protein